MPIYELLSSNGQEKPLQVAERLGSLNINKARSLFNLDAKLHSDSWPATADKTVLQSAEVTASEWRTSKSILILPVASFEARMIELSLATFSSSTGDSEIK